MDPGGNIVLIMFQTQMIVTVCFAFTVIIYKLTVNSSNCSMYDIFNLKLLKVRVII